MRKRFQNGRVVKSSDGRYWIGKWLEDGRDRSKVLGKTAQMTKTKAREEMAQIVKPINERVADEISPNVTVEDFVDKVYLPLYRRKWKRSTAMTNKDRIKHHIVSESVIGHCGQSSEMNCKSFLKGKQICHSARQITFDGT